MHYNENEQEDRVKCTCGTLVIDEKIIIVSITNGKPNEKHQFFAKINKNQNGMFVILDNCKEAMDVFECELN